MNVLIIGSGGREHALGWKAAQNPNVETIFVAPGNAGTALEPKLENVNIDVEDIAGLVAFAKEKAIELTIVGPEAPLVIGVVDAFREAGLPIFGPTQAAAQLEGSKAFTKDFLARHQIPTGAYANFTEIEPALAYVREQGAPIVVKADGLAAGKGVIVAMTLEEAEDAIKDMLGGNAFGDAGSRVVIEEFLDGEEASFIVMVDGENVLPMATSQDHKRVGDKDTGPNTGGMGAYSPAPVVTPEIHNRIMEEVIYPTVRGMASEGNPYTGFLYAGLMIDKDGTPKVIEYNCRFGDPETEVLLPRLRSDLLAICDATAHGRLADVPVEWSADATVGVMMALHHRNANGGKGQVVDVALYEAVFNMMEGMLPEFDLLGEIRERTGSGLTGIVPSNTYPTKSGQHIVIGANADSIFKRLMVLMGRQDLADDPSLADNAGRVVRGDDLDRIIGEWTARFTVEELAEKLNGAQVPNGKIYSIADIVSDAQYMAREMIREVQLTDGLKLKVPGVVPKLAATPGTLEWVGPTLGAHTNEVLGNLGIAKDQIESLRARKIV